MRAQRRRRVGLFMGLIDHYEHGIARGVVRFARGRPDWDLYGYGWMFQAMGSLERWDGDGIIARIESARDADLLAARGIPVVDVAGAWPRPGFRQVSNDDRATGRLAGRHLKALGRRTFAFCGVARVGWSRHRREAFRDVVAVTRLSVFEQSLGWWEKLHRSEAFDRWLAALPRPAALFACNDTVGLKAAAAARRLGLERPRATSPSWGWTTRTSSASSPCRRCPASRWTSSASGGRRRRPWPRSWTAGAGRAGRRSCPRAKWWSASPRGRSPRETRWWTARWEPSTAPPPGGSPLPSSCRRSPARGGRWKRGSAPRWAAASTRRSSGGGSTRRAACFGTRRSRLPPIAAETGFANAQRFYAAFRKVMGVTPGAYRRSYLS